MREWLKDLRISKGLTQNKVAEATSVDVTTINKIELGIRRPSPELAKRIANELGFEWVKFFEDGSTNKR